METLRDKMLYAVKVAVHVQIARRLHDVAIEDLMNALDTRSKTAVEDGGQCPKCGFSFPHKQGSEITPCEKCRAVLLSYGRDGKGVRGTMGPGPGPRGVSEKGCSKCAAFPSSTEGGTLCAHCRRRIQALEVVTEEAVK